MNDFRAKLTKFMAVCHHFLEGDLILNQKTDFNIHRIEIFF